MSVHREWIHWLVWEKIRLRVSIKLDHGSVDDFVVQLEIFDDDWTPVVRYNYAHGMPHRDMYHKTKTKTKELLYIDDLNELVSFAEQDLKQHWRRYLNESGYYENLDG